MTAVLCNISQKRCSQHQLGVPRTYLISPHPNAPRDKYPTSTTAQQLPIILSNQWSFLVLRQQEEQRASQVTKVQQSSGKAHTSIISLIISAPLWLSLYPHVTGRERLFCSAKIIVGELREKGEGWWHFMELKFPPGPRPLSLPLPFYLLPRFFLDPLYVTWDHSLYSAPLAISKQDISFKISFQGVL